jgi:mRNA capping enzyme, catalytic domain.
VKRLKKELPKINVKKILFRYKQRVSVPLAKAKLDITDVKESYDITKLFNYRSKYEVEIEFIDDFNIDDVLNNWVELFVQIHNTFYPITKSESNEVIESYQKLLNIKDRLLRGRNVITLEAHHLVKFVPNNYAITDKMDGERNFMFILPLGIYFLDKNLIVKKTPYYLPKYHYSIFDGELVGKIFKIFDLVFF